MGTSEEPDKGLEVNGVAHVILRLNRIAECIAFYDRLMPFLGLLAEGATFRPDADHPLSGKPRSEG